MSEYNIIIETENATVVTEYKPEYKVSKKYQSEAELEREFIEVLQSQGYEYIKINNEVELIKNLRVQLEKLNDYEFTDSEWDYFFKNCIVGNNEGVLEKTRKIQEDYIQNLKRDDGTTKNIKLIEKKDIYKNRLQVLNQYEEDRGKHENRYDVTILVNGLPLVHVELKARGVDIREAFNQIKRYQRDSFWASCGLYQYIQIFVISNGTFTKYYSNTTRDGHVKEMQKVKEKNLNIASNSYSFTSYWTDFNNEKINDLIDFAKTFFRNFTLLNLITKYCVFNTLNELLVMRPYQICATEEIIKRINISNNYKKAGTKEAGGYIWHTTGSGKTLTSFKTAQLAANLPFIYKVLFVVDRKDLDNQTINEYQRFQKGCVSHNKSTRQLEEKLNKDDEKIIVTTIQKLGNLTKKYKKHPIYDKHVVIIFDECHRSQFGETHQAIIKKFKNYYIFGFTGTPIFAKNSNSQNIIKTTPQLFGEKLHTYTIVNAINDKNVLKFNTQYWGKIVLKDDIKDEKINKIDEKKYYEKEERIKAIAKYIVENFDQKTLRNKNYKMGKEKVNGFNSIFAVDSINMLKKYYVELKKQIEEAKSDLKIAAIFSFAPNEEFDEDYIDEDFDNDKLDKPSRDFLEDCIEDYNKMFGTSYDTSGENFENYYRNISEKMKKKELDILLVVNMFLTGFDAKCLNTLWVDKNLKMHGLIQAYSRTNRILNSVKTHGNIICFRNLEKELNEAMAMFGDKDALSIVLIKTFAEYFNGYKEGDKYYPGYKEIAEKIKEEFSIEKEIISMEKKKEFVSLFGTYLRLSNILSSFDEFAENKIMTPREEQDYKSIYIDIYDEIRPKGHEKENINDDVVFEMELIKQIDVDVDYILSLVEKYRESNNKDKKLLVDIQKIIDSSLEMRSKKELINEFIARINLSNSNTNWSEFIKEKKEKDLLEIIESENLKEKETRKFVENTFETQNFKSSGQDIDRILPAASGSLFSRGKNSRANKKKTVIQKLEEFFSRYFGV